MRRSDLSRFWTVIAGGFVLLLAITYISVTNGEFDISAKDVFKTLLRFDPVPEYDLVLFEFRMPRIVLGALVGLGLGVAGATIQSVTRNGLADPGILGINAGASLAVVLFLFLYQGQVKGTGWIAAMTMPLFGWVGSMCAAAAIFALAWRQGRLDSQRLLLAGIAIASGLGAGTLYLSLKMNARDFEMAAVWMAGSIWNANWRFVASMLPWLVLLIPVIWFKSRILDLFQLEESSVKSLGVAAERNKWVLLLCSVGLVSACVSVSGSISFVGLMAPHIARALIGLRHSRIVPVSGLVGVLLVMIGDFIGKTEFAPAELSVGIVISIIGVPYFVYLLLRAKA